MSNSRDCAHTFVTHFPTYFVQAASITLLFPASYRPPPARNITVWTNCQQQEKGRGADGAGENKRGGWGASREEREEDQEKGEWRRQGTTQARDPDHQHQELVSESDVSENSKFIKPELRENSGLYISDRVLNQTADTGVIPAFQGE